MSEFLSGVWEVVRERMMGLLFIYYGVGAIAGVILCIMRVCTR